MDPRQDTSSSAPLSAARAALLPPGLPAAPQEGQGASSIPRAAHTPEDRISDSVRMMKDRDPFDLQM